MKSERIHWVDQWRGLAVALMIVYHIAYDLNYLEIAPINQRSLFWFIEGNFIRLTFLLIVGISLYLSRKKYPTFLDFFKRHFIRAITLFGIAMIITLATWLMDRDNAILFGILHLISFGIFFGALIVRHPFLPILLGLFSFYFGAAFSGLQSDIPYLLPLGITYPGFTSFDYFPIFPWIGFIFFGIALAHFLDRAACLKHPIGIPRSKTLEFLGQHALFVYLIHQPILIGGLWLFTKF